MRGPRCALPMSTRLCPAVFLYTPPLPFLLVDRRPLFQPPLPLPVPMAILPLPTPPTASGVDSNPEAPGEGSLGLPRREAVDLMLSHLQLPG